MAYNNVLESVTLAIEVENGKNVAGGQLYRKRNYTGIKGTASAEDIGAVADAIKAILTVDARNTYKNSVEKIEKQD